MGNPGNPSIASLTPGARAVLRRITDLGGTASSDQVQQYSADRPTTPITKAKTGETLTSCPLWGLGHLLGKPLGRHPRGVEAIALLSRHPLRPRTGQATRSTPLRILPPPDRAS